MTLQNIGNQMQRSLGVLFLISTILLGTQTAFAQSDRLTKAVERYKKEPPDYLSASILLKQVLDSKPNKADKATAEFYMGKTLYQLGYYAGALAFFNRIVEEGPSHQYHGATLKWLAALAKELPESSGILEKIGTYDESALEADILSEVKDELYYLLGKHYYNQGTDTDFAKAINLFRKVDDKSKVFVKSRFLEAVTHVRQNKAKPALKAFKEILIIGVDRNQYEKYYGKDEITRLEQLTVHQLARVFYTAGKYKLAIKYFEQLPQSAPGWVDAVWESSWAYFMITNNSKALGNIHTLNSPFFENRFFPESHLLKAVIHYKYCQYDAALESVQEFNQKYRPLRKTLRETLAKYEDDADMFDFVQKLRAGEGEIDSQARRLILSVLNDSTLEKAFAWVDELDFELEKHKKAEPSWKGTEVGNMVLQELTLQHSFAKADAGRAARNRVDGMIKELSALSRNGTRVKVEVLGRKAGDTPIDESQILTPGEDEKIVVDDEHISWKFNGEYWKDELGYYRVAIDSKCQGADGTKRKEDKAPVDDAGEIEGDSTFDDPALAPGGDLGGEPEGDLELEPDPVSEPEGK